MSLAAVPDDDELCIGGMWQPGRQLRAASGIPVAWVSGRAFGCGLTWADLADESAESGLQPFLLPGMDGGTARPWDTGEAVSRRTPGPSTAWMPPRCWMAGGHAGRGGQGTGGEGRYETGAPHGLGGLCRRTRTRGAGAGVVAGAVGDQSAQRPANKGSKDVIEVTMHFHT